MYSSVFLLSRPRPPCSTLFPYTTLFRSLAGLLRGALTELLRAIGDDEPRRRSDGRERLAHVGPRLGLAPPGQERSEEHTSELQSRVDLVCRLLLEKKKKNMQHQQSTKCS